MWRRRKKSWARSRFTLGDKFHSFDLEMFWNCLFSWSFTAANPLRCIDFGEIHLLLLMLLLMLMRPLLSDYLSSYQFGLVALFFFTLTQSIFVLHFDTMVPFGFKQLHTCLYATCSSIWCFFFCWCCYCYCCWWCLSFENV